MTELIDLLVQSGVFKALVIDDAFDPVPLASDLRIELDEWTTLFDDLSAPDKARLGDLHPPFAQQRADELRDSDEFVEALWANREELTAGALDPLFSRYIQDNGDDLQTVNPLVAHLRSLGLACETAGRNFEEQARGADLIFIDLYLNAAQRPEDINLSITGLSNVVKGRKSDPPLVILMSRSNRLPQKRAEFQDRAALFESNFRILAKSELANLGVVNQSIVRLASHYPDSKKLAAFVDAWDRGLKNAGKRTTDLIRKLGLADIAQIYRLLLSTEGEPTGSYLVDVFDKVLQHEIEGEQEIIAAARDLNGLTGQKFPPPYVPGATDLQDLIHRFQFQNRARLSLPGAIDSHVAFGDLIRRKAVASAPAEVDTSPANAVAAHTGENPLVGIDAETVLAVLTPACDLQRGGARKVLLLVGALKKLTPKAWHYRDEGPKTPVLELQDGARFWIKWNLKHIETLSHDELQRLLRNDGHEFEIVARLREAHALELQQRLLSNLGRVGLAAPMPATFEWTVEAYLPDAQMNLIKLAVPTLYEGGVCFVGRAETPNKSEERLMLTETACEAIVDAITTVDLNTVHEKTRPLIEQLRQSNLLAETLGSGVSLNGNSNEFKAIKAGETTLGLVRSSKIEEGDKLNKGQVVVAGIVLSVFEPQDAEKDIAGEKLAAEIRPS